MSIGRISINYIYPGHGGLEQEVGERLRHGGRGSHGQRDAVWGSTRRSELHSETVLVERQYRWEVSWKVKTNHCELG